MTSSSRRSRRTSDNDSSRKRKEKEAKLEQDRLRYLQFAYVTTGIPTGIPTGTDCDEEESQNSADNTDSDTQGSASSFHDPRTAQPEAGNRSAPPIPAGLLPEPLPTSFRDEAPVSMSYAPRPITSRSQSQPQFEQTYASPDCSQAPRRPQSIFYVDLIDPNGCLCEVQISDDTGTPDNWIHPYLIEQHLLPWEYLSKPEYYEDASGKTVKTTRCVKLKWLGRDNRQYYTIFYVGAPGVSIARLLLGDIFVTNNGRAREVCRLDRRVQDAKVLAQAPITAREATEIQVSGARADAAAAHLKRARESTSSRRKHNTSARQKGKNLGASETRQTPTMHQDDRSMGPPVDYYYGPQVDDNNTYDSSIINPPVDHNNTNDSLGINWGPWRRLPNGQWHREGQDSLGNWYEEDRDG